MGGIKQMNTLDALAIIIDLAQSFKLKDEDCNDESHKLKQMIKQERALYKVMELFNKLEKEEKLNKNDSNRW